MSYVFIFYKYLLNRENGKEKKNKRAGRREPQRRKEVEQVARKMRKVKEGNKGGRRISRSLEEKMKMMMMKL